MPIDAGIYNALSAPPKSMADYQQQYNAIDQQNNALAQGRMALDQAKAVMQQRNALRQAVQSGQIDLTNDQHQGQALAIAPDVAPALLKTVQDSQTSKAVAAKDLASAKKSNFDTELAQHSQHLQQLASVGSPEDAINWAITSRKSGVGPLANMPMDQFMSALQRIPADPSALAAWKNQAMQTGMSIKDQMESAMKEREFGLRANNELITPNAGGGYVVNKPLLEAKNSIAKSGAAKTDIKIDNKFGEGVAKEVGPMLKSSYDSAIGAQSSVLTADSILKAVESGKVIAGPGASWRLRIAQFADTLGVGGKDTQEQIANTRSVIQGLAQSTVAARKQLAGQGQVTEGEQKLLERAVSGNIDEMTTSEIRQLAELNKRLSKRVMSMHGDFVKKIQAQPSTEGLATMFELPESGNTVEAVSQPAPAAKKAAPSAAAHPPDIEALLKKWSQ